MKLTWMHPVAVWRVWRVQRLNRTIARYEAILRIGRHEKLADVRLEIKKCDEKFLKHKAWLEQRGFTVGEALHSDLRLMPILLAFLGLLAAFLIIAGTAYLYRKIASGW